MGGHGLKGTQPLEQFVFVLSLSSEPMTTGLYWNLHYRRDTGDVSQIIVMDQSDDQWPQDPVFKQSGEARSGESAPAAPPSCAPLGHAACYDTTQKSHHQVGRSPCRS